MREKNIIFKIIMVIDNHNIISIQFKYYCNACNLNHLINQISINSQNKIALI